LFNITLVSENCQHNANQRHFGYAHTSDTSTSTSQLVRLTFIVSKWATVEKL